MISNWAPSPPGRVRSRKGVSGLSCTAARIVSARIARLKLRMMFRSGATEPALSPGSTEVSIGRPSVVKCQEWSSVFC